MQKRISECVVGDKLVSFGYGLSRNNVTILKITKVYKKYVVANDGHRDLEINFDGHIRGSSSGSYYRSSYAVLTPENQERVDFITLKSKALIGLNKMQDLLTRTYYSVDNAQNKKEIHEQLKKAGAESASFFKAVEELISSQKTEEVELPDTLDNFEHDGGGELDER